MREPGGAVGREGRPAEAPVEAKVVLLDSESGLVTWMNEAAVGDLASGRSGIGLPLAEAVPLSASLGLQDTVEAVTVSGEPAHREVSLVSTARGSLTIVASVYRLPAGGILIVMDRTFQAGSTSEGGRRGSRAPRV